MSGNRCHRCYNQLSSEPVFRRACCGASFHQRCIQSGDLICCPRCGLNSLSHFSRILLWIPMVSLLVEEATDHPPANRRRVEGRDKCVICLEEFTEMAMVVATKSCCRQTAHVDCLRSYYDLPATCRDERERQEIMDRVGVPNCFVCRGTSTSIVPLDAEVLRAIWPGVQSNVRQGNREQANQALERWLQMCTLLVATLWRDEEHDFEWIKLYAAVGFKNGKKEYRTFTCRGGPASGAECRSRLSSTLQKLVAGWGSLPTNRQRFDDITCHAFSLHDIVELLVQVKVVRRSRSTAQSEHQSNMSCWKYTSRFFEFDSVTYGGQRLPRVFRWGEKLLARS